MQLVEFKFENTAEDEQDGGLQKYYPDLHGGEWQS